MNKKGVEMALQIFIVLFVLLAVSMLVLQLVSEQFSKRSQDLEETQRKQAYETKVNEARSDCRNLCIGKSTENNAQFCLKYYDLTPTGAAPYDENYLMPGFSVCTDRIYCPQLITDCFVGDKPLTMADCKTIVCNYWKTTGVTAGAILNSKLQQFIKPGTCPCAGGGTAIVNDHWFKVVYNVNSITNFNCP